MKKAKFDLSLLKENAKSLRVLFIENHAGTRYKLSRILKEYFYDVQVCVYSENALSTFKTNKFDLIVVDANLEGISALDICKSIKAIASKKPIIILSHIQDHDELIEFINIGINGFFRLPLNQEEIISVLAKVSKDIIDLKVLYESFDLNILVNKENKKEKAKELNDSSSVNEEVPKVSVDSLFIDLESMSAAELYEAYPTDLEIVGDKLLEIIDSMDISINRFLNHTTQQNALAVSLEFEMFANTLENITLFSNIVIATRKLAHIFENIDCSKSYKEYRDIIDLVSLSLSKWVGEIFIEKTSPDIYYMDKSIIADALTVENLFLETYDDSQPDAIEFF